MMIITTNNNNDNTNNNNNKLLDDEARVPHCQQHAAGLEIVTPIRSVLICSCQHVAKQLI